MTYEANVLIHDSGQVTEPYPNCRVPGCPDRFMEEVHEDIARHFHEVHPGIQPVVGS